MTERREQHRAVYATPVSGFICEGWRWEMTIRSVQVIFKAGNHLRYGSSTYGARVLTS